MPLGIIIDILFPNTSTPNDIGVTSIREIAPALPDLSSLSIPPYTAAPYATASSGLILFLGSLPSKKFLISDCIFGIRVDPPTNMIS